MPHLKVINDIGCEIACVEIKSTKEIADAIYDWELKIGDTLKITD